MEVRGKQEIVKLAPYSYSPCLKETEFNLKYTLQHFRIFGPNAKLANLNLVYIIRTFNYRINVTSVVTYHDKSSPKCEKGLISF